MELLDDPATVERLDPSGLLGRIAGLPEQCEDAWKHAGSLELPERLSEARELVVLGMGGSGIAGAILRSLALLTGRKPVAVVRGYGVPGHVGPSTLAIACSHSGNTEETLSALTQALDAGASAFALTKGGRLAELAAERNVPLYTYTYDGEPRSALGLQLMVLLALGERAGALESQDAAVSEAAGLMREQRRQLGFVVPIADNPAKQLAARLHGRLPVVIGGGVLVEAAYRWKTQFTENSKCWALHEELPELDHNTIVGFGLPREIVARMRPVFLTHPGLHPRLLLRIDGTAEALADAGIKSECVEALGSSPLAQVLTAIFHGDFVSYYLALLNGVDPSPVAPIEKLKARLEGS